MESELRKIPNKNYFILGIILIVTVLALYYFYMWFDVYNDSKLNKPILDRYMEVINYNELDNYIVENPDSIIYVSILDDMEIREFERNFKNSFRNNKVNGEILYLDLTESIKDSSTKKDIMNKYSVNSLNISDVPCILVIRDGMVNSIYNIKDNDYDVNKLELFLNDNILKEAD